MDVSDLIQKGSRRWYSLHLSLLGCHIQLLTMSSNNANDHRFLALCTTIFALFFSCDLWFFLLCNSGYPRCTVSLKRNQEMGMAPQKQVTNWLTNSTTEPRRTVLNWAQCFLHFCLRIYPYIFRLYQPWSSFNPHVYVKSPFIKHLLSSIMVRSDFEPFTIMYGEISMKAPYLGCKWGTPFHPHWFIINSPIIWWRWSFGVCALLTDPTMLVDVGWLFWFDPIHVPF